MDYHAKLASRGFETNDYEGKDITSKNITDYLVKQMVCGVDTLAGEALTTGGTLGQWGLGPQKFKIPRLPFKNHSEFNPCDGSRMRIPLGPHESAWPQGWPGGYKGHGIYSYIEDNYDVSKNYVGVVHYLYEELPDYIVNGFDAWWERVVRHEFEKNIQKIYQDIFIKKVVNGGDGMLSRNSFINLVEGDKDLNDNCVDVCDDFSVAENATIAESVKQQLDTIFNYHLEPMFKSKHFTVKTESYTEDPTIEEGDAKVILLEQFKNLKTKLYDILFFMLGKQDSLKDESLRELYSHVEEEYMAQGAMINSSANLDLEAVKLLVLNSLVRYVQYEIAIIFQSDTVGLINAVTSAGIQAIESGRWESRKIFSDLAYTDKDKERVKTEFLADRDLLIADYKSLENRKDKILLEYKDWPYAEEGAEQNDDILSPNLRGVISAQGKIDALFQEVFSLYATKLSVRGFN